MADQPQQLTDARALEQIARAVLNSDFDTARGMAFEIVSKIDLEKDDPTEAPVWTALYKSRCSICNNTIGPGFDVVTIFEAKTVHEYCAEERRAEMAAAEAERERTAA